MQEERRLHSPSDCSLLTSEQILQKRFRVRYCRMQEVPWLFSVATAFVFGMMAHRAGRSKFPWILGGALFGLVVSAFVLGLSQAVFMREAHEAYVIFRIKVILISALLIAVPGWFLTGSLHSQLLALWQTVRKRFAKTEPQNTTLPRNSA